MISVIIPVFNGEQFIADAIKSARDADEIIVADDGSTDNSAQIATDAGAKIIKLNHGGAVVARNTGIRAASGDMIILHDADDVMEPGAIEKLSAAISDADLVMAKRKDFPGGKPASFGALAGCALIRRDAFDRIGFFDEDLQYGDAMDWLIRAKKANLKIMRLDETICMRRIHENNMGKNRDAETKDYAKIIRKHYG
jgi:glycosyltransferase involved in cell wall biosynthesis